MYLFKLNLTDFCATVTSDIAPYVADDDVNCNIFRGEKIVRFYSSLITESIIFKHTIFKYK